MLAVNAVLREKRVVVPAEDEPQVYVGVAEKVVVTLDAALPVPPPPPDGVAHVPSPRQNVELLAEVPLFRLLTGRFVEFWAETSAARIKNKGIRLRIVFIIDRVS